MVATGERASGKFFPCLQVGLDLLFLQLISGDHATLSLLFAEISTLDILLGKISNRILISMKFETRS